MFRRNEYSWFQGSPEQRVRTMEGAHLAYRVPRGAENTGSIYRAPTVAPRNLRPTSFEHEHDKTSADLDGARHDLTGCRDLPGIFALTCLLDMSSGLGLPAAINCLVLSLVFVFVLVLVRVSMSSGIGSEHEHQHELEFASHLPDELQP
ncbi:hypothetical protein I317_07607 [Kwoniella heveanensis CBS 569]|uniref:Uncharacterized protein n=1 Tax=Kwoniella heveanensis BCC8398 TaxID=1296120 RepID=A0A1B9GUY9_9TREE|nr:hypothetical protein I316_03392 [Kwoniella heveanensis BCC8398]OCF38617.1 hypothetical protein I317_07607 [Kwoniella heveanensis CBS 569]